MSAARSRALSHNIETERALLGGMLMAPQFVTEIAQVVSASDLVTCMTELRRGAAELAIHGGATFGWSAIWEVAGVASRASQALIQAVLAPRWRALGDGRWTLHVRTEQERQALDNVAGAGRRQRAGRDARRTVRRRPAR